LARLAYVLEASGKDKQALATYEKLLERTPEDETTRRKYIKVRKKLGLEPVSGEISQPVKLAPTEVKASLATPASSEPALEEETQRYVTQALTDVDLFSSYGLTQKAIGLLESVLERAPQHTPILERLMDLSVGAGNDRRTVELATILEQIAIDRHNRAAAERYAEYRRRFQRAVGNIPGETPAAPAQPPSAAPQEFAIPTIEAELDEPVAKAPSEESPATSLSSMGIPMPVESVVHEVDLSDEWAALSRQLEDPMPVGAQQPEALPPASFAIPEPPAFELELQPIPPAGAAAIEGLTADTLLADLAADFESAAASLGIPEEPTSAQKPSPPQPPPPQTAKPSPSAPANGTPAVPSGGTTVGPLADLFEEFRSDMGEVNKEDEDLETHYNLGIAYREMGLLEEAISEFQKVASSADKGPAFRYAMQCSTLLGLAFMEKGQPAIAAIWYERALQTPGLDPESILALRYDLGVAQELAGEADAAFRSFSQVYAMNIDYRDVSERIALLGKTR